MALGHSQKPASAVQGIVTHVTDVKPLIKVATYLDEESGVEVYQEVTGEVSPDLPVLLR